jgi:hypothetical protein
MEHLFLAASVFFLLGDSVQVDHIVLLLAKAEIIFLLLVLMGQMRLSLNLVTLPFLQAWIIWFLLGQHFLSMFFFQVLVQLRVEINPPHDCRVSLEHLQLSNEAVQEIRQDLEVAASLELES